MDVIPDIYNLDNFNKPASGDHMCAVQFASADLRIRKHNWLRQVKSADCTFELRTPHIIISYDYINNMIKITYDEVNTIIFNSDKYVRRIGITDNSYVIIDITAIILKMDKYDHNINGIIYDTLSYRFKTFTYPGKNIVYDFICSSEIYLHISYHHNLPREINEGWIYNAKVLDNISLGRITKDESIYLNPFFIFSNENKPLTYINMDKLSFIKNMIYGNNDISLKYKVYKYYNNIIIYLHRIITSIDDIEIIYHGKKHFKLNTDALYSLKCNLDYDISIKHNFTIYLTSVMKYIWVATSCIKLDIS